MGCVSVAAMACLKTLLMIFNFVFSFSGTAVIFVGLWVYFRMSTILELSAVHSSTVFYMLIATGTITVVAGLLACCFTAKGHAGLLYAYGFFIILTMILEIGEGIYIAVYRYKLADGLDKGINQTIIDYRSSDSPNSRELDLLQSTLHCCGNHNYTDWLNSNHVIPKSCCKWDICDVTNVDDIYTQGCHDKVIDLVISHSGIVAYVAVGFALFSIIGVFLSCCLARTIRKANYEQIE